MARNEEKALTLFSKWTTFKHDYHASIGNRRPLLASDCESLPEAEKWRRELVRDITKKIAAIQNGSLGEHRIRELNDEINKMQRQKHYWETRIRELGGDTMKGRQHLDVEGKELPGAPGYKYYGAAKDLPGVRELFSERDEEVEARKQQKRSRGDVYRHITPDYYGYRDDDDGILAAKEQEREAILLAQARSEFAVRKAVGSSAEDGDSNEGDDDDEEDEAAEDYLLPGANNSFGGAITSGSNGGLERSVAGLRPAAAVGLPSQEELEASLVDQKKKLLLERMLL